MKSYFSPLKLKDSLSLAALIGIGFGWILVDQVFLPEVKQRLIALIVLTFVLFYLQFAINKPVSVIKYCNSIALIIASFVLITSIVMHVIINHDFSYKAVLILLTSVLVPYISGVVYAITRKKQR